MSDALSRIEQLKVIPIMTLDDPADAVPVAEALLAGGLPCAEVTFRTGAAAEAIREIRSMGKMLVGAGTVLTTEQVDQAIDAGVEFMVTPGLNPAVVKRCLDRGVAIFPGVSTPTDIEVALGLGLKVVKYFPMEAFGGLKTLKAVSGPYHMMRFIPTGGISTDNLKSYLSFPKVVACGGSWLAKKDMIEAGDFDQITRLAKQAVQIASEV